MIVSFRPDTIFCGDCEDVLGGFPDGRVDLIYTDPPFYSNRTHEAVSGDGQEKRAFEDRWEGGIQSYISWMEPRLRQCHRVLRGTGSMYLHCDWHASHYLKVLMDKIFGENFQREIIWRVGWVSGYRAGRRTSSGTTRRSSSTRNPRNSRSTSSTYRTRRATNAAAGARTLGGWRWTTCGWTFTRSSTSASAGRS